MNKTEHASTTSRRTILMGLAAAAVVPAPALTTALENAEAKAAEVDPIHALIAEHIEALKARCQANEIWGSIPVNLPEYEAAEEVLTKAGDRAHELLMELLSAKPTTLEGVAALLAHVGRPEFLTEYPEHPDCRETLLSSMNEYTSHELKRHGQDFPVRLAETLRGLIAEA